MRRFIAGSWMVGSAALIFSLSSTQTSAQTKSYQQILYGEAVAKAEAVREELPASKPVMVEPVKAQPIALDTTEFLSQTIRFTGSYINTAVSLHRNTFYQANQFQTKWLYNSEPAPIYYTLIQRFKNADLYGLNPEDYATHDIEKLVNVLYDGSAFEPRELMALDVRLTELYMLFIMHLSEGKIRNTGVGNALWLREPASVKKIDVISLSQVNSAQDLDKIFESIQPDNDQYRKLQQALAYYGDLDRQSEKLAGINLNGKIEPNTRHSAIPLIRKRLSQFDVHVYPTLLDTVTGQWDTLLYDAGLAEGIIAFQLVHGLQPDGVIGPMTVTYLNKTLQNRVEAIKVNLDRLRWNTPFKDAENYIRVNIPEYTLRMYNKQEEVFQMRVIVGAVDNPTPVFTDRIKHVVFSPTWTVPVSIIKNEIIPRLQANPDYYTEKNYVFYKNGEQIDPAGEAWGSVSAGNYRVVQQSGGDNSLGRVKFGMTNDMRIYLHDTPSQRLFSKDYRALSHGCIRLDEPARFAEYLLRENSGWDEARVNKQMFSGNASTVMLKKDYPVRMEYCTAWVDQQGRVNFREDIYGHDRMQVRQLNEPALKPSGVIAGL